jgi:hypothetical protein
VPVEDKPIPVDDSMIAVFFTLGAGINHSGNPNCRTNIKRKERKGKKRWIP